MHGLEADLVADELKRRGAECGGQLGPDGDQRRAHDGESRRIRVPAAANERRRRSRARASSAVICGPAPWTTTTSSPAAVAIADDVERVARDTPAELQDDTHQVVYSAFRRT